MLTKTVVKVGAAAVNNAVEVKTTKDGLNLNVEKNAVNLVKNTVVDLAVDGTASKVAKNGKKVLSVAGVNQGTLSKTAKNAVKSAGGKVTRNVNKDVKKGAEKIVKGAGRAIESGTKAIVNSPVDELKKKTEVK